VEVADRAPGRDLLERYGLWKTAHEWLRLRTAGGTWDKILAAVIVRDDAMRHVRTQPSRMVPLSHRALVTDGQ
jgi:hypothetical protein